MNSGEVLYSDNLGSRESWQKSLVLQKNFGNVALANIDQPVGVSILDEPIEALEALVSIAYQDEDIDQELSMLLEDTENVDLDDVHQVKGLRDALMEHPQMKATLNHRLEKAHQELIAIYPKVRTAFTEGVYAGIGSGHLPPSVADRIAGTLDQTTVHVIDSAVLGTFGEMSAYYQNERDEVGIAHDASEPHNTQYDHLMHELTHKLSAGTFVHAADGLSQERVRVGFTAQKKPGVFTRKGLNEALTHHVTMGIMTGDFETIDPDAREDKTYYAYRKVLAAFVGQSHGLVETKTLLHAFFEDTTPSGNDLTARRKLACQVSSAYEPGALRKLDRLLELSGDIPIKQLAPLVLARVHPPEYSASGNMTRKAYIDIEDMPNFYDLLSRT
jgi:hypothetical protein